MKDMKLEALEAMMGEQSSPKVESKDSDGHMAKCPKCGHKWMMDGKSDDYEENED